jgi:hypothetical protein
MSNHRASKPGSLELLRYKSELTEHRDVKAREKDANAAIIQEVENKLTHFHATCNLNKFCSQ